MPYVTEEDIHYSGGGGGKPDHGGCGFGLDTIAGSVLGGAVGTGVGYYMCNPNTAALVGAVLGGLGAVLTKEFLDPYGEGHFMAGGLCGALLGWLGYLLAHDLIWPKLEHKRDHSQIESRLILAENPMTYESYRLKRINPDFTKLDKNVAEHIKAGHDIQNY